MFELFVSDGTLKRIVDERCMCMIGENKDNFKFLYTSEYGESKAEDSRTMFARQDKEIKEMIYKAGKADGIANFLMLACDEFNGDDECIEYEPKVRQKLIEIAEMLKKEI